MKKYSLIFLAVLAWAGCGGSSGSIGGGSGGTTVTGNVPATPAALVKNVTASANCVADTIIATDTTGASISADMEDDCSFSLTLSLDTSYILSLVLNGDFVATLIYDSGISGFTTSVLRIDGSSSLIDLGQLTISGNVATVGNNPMSETDQDDDGDSDFTDTDDDNDDISDANEPDCDLDGIINDYDEENDTCDNLSSDNTVARVTEVKPRNDPHPESGEDLIDLDKEVKARISCEIDQSTVTADTFRVETEDMSSSIDCSYEFGDSGETGNRVVCKHDSDPFLVDTTYVATIDGVRCLDGRSVTAGTWTWHTMTSDSTSGDAEDEIDDSESDNGDTGEDDGDDDD